ncbi:Sec7 domain-containing protein, partial [Ochromonadaceae sp. CCMP2298]
FVDKPARGLAYLQACGALPTPLTPPTVAKFLRISPQLPKEAVGAFLGELGRDSAECGGRAFQADVLAAYISSFEFEDHSVLDCLRIFLSAFRLPGEAQQIDRILVAFSERCHLQSRECRAGHIQNAEITYVLTFSIIMLNTDRHNPNIRQDRRMTREQFLRNNANYGQDVHQTL